LFAPRVCFDVLRDVFGKVNGLDHEHLWEVYYKGISLVFNGPMEVAEAKTVQANRTLDTCSGGYEPTKHFKFTFESQY
jgi:ATP-dependent Clp protease adapter protein ClpS